MEIKIGLQNHPAVMQLLTDHHQEMMRHSPPESVHALDLEALSSPNIRFWSLWDNDNLAGCCALKALAHDHGEIKSMKTAKQYLRRGVARQLLQHVINEAKNLKYQRLSLETGTMAAFTPAHKLYQSFGFTSCAPFAPYQADPYSTFMTLQLV
ncbi:GNAT family N-acetyltransferase [Thalassotalea sp. G2M2-11]|uniref:GNAT family N-acetyltransferase n=1 Tax=Thalassotalea sp. G2M2-11 TaxID=2787627 RepID=UPI0019D0F0F3|nr:GNAT family N-acetyltransferase [Thalassotalea sp. G2M2-11]